jgi:pimeloyl-ACP methyl ester carboxylesterase
MRVLWCVVVTVVGTIVATRAEAQETRTVSINGRPMEVRVGGRDRPGPTVVLEAAFAESLKTWDSVFNTLTTVAPTFAYSRAGLGGSTFDGVTPTPAHVAEQLHQLLAAAGMKPPYVLVGHSWGGLLARMFAAKFPGEVKGMVYIDPTDLRTLAEEQEYYRDQGYTGEAMIERKASLLRFRNPDVGEAKALLEAVNGDFKDFRALPPSPDVPTAMLMSANFGSDPWRGSPCAPAVCQEALVKWRIRWLRAMMAGSSNATLTVATALGHFMHIEEPSLVTAAIQRVVVAARMAHP